MAITRRLKILKPIIKYGINSRKLVFLTTCLKYVPIRSCYDKNIIFALK